MCVQLTPRRPCPLQRGSSGDVAALPNRGSLQMKSGRALSSSGDGRESRPPRDAPWPRGHLHAAPVASLRLPLSAPQNVAALRKSRAAEAKREEPCDGLLSVRLTSRAIDKYRARINAKKRQSSRERSFSQHESPVPVHNAAVQTASGSVCS